MKKNAHPKYQQVLFVDSATGTKFICGSTIQSSKTETVDGESYPVIDLSISSFSHPFFVGGKQIIDTEGRVDKFNKRYQAAQVKKQAETISDSTETAATAAVASKKRKK